MGLSLIGPASRCALAAVGLERDQCAAGTWRPGLSLAQGRAGSDGEVWRGKCAGLEGAGRVAEASTAEAAAAGGSAGTAQDPVAAEGWVEASPAPGSAEECPKLDPRENMNT